MKKIFLLFLLCIGMSTYAQYFQRYFNEVVTAVPARTEAYNDGLKSRVNYAGGNPKKYYLVGTGYSELSPSTATDARLRFIRTNTTGALGVNIGYQFGDVSPLWFESRGKDLCEIDNGVGTGGYVIVGEVNNNSATGATGIPGGTDMFFGTFSNSGTPTLRERIDVNGGADVALGVVRSVFMPGTYLVCGYSVKGPTTNAVVARINGAGAVIWLRDLDMVATAQCRTTSVSYATSLCEDPASGNVYVCGRVSGHIAGAIGTDGLVFAVSSAGAPLWQVYHDLGGSADQYQDIKFTSGGNILVCGFSNLPAGVAGPFNDVWLSLFNPTLMPAAAGMIWSFKHRFAGPLEETKGYRVIEGKNSTAGGIRFYVVGPVYSAAGGPPIQMMLEVFGGGVGGGTYHTYPPPYGPLGFDDRFGLDSVEMNMPAPGLAIFSSTVQPPTGPQSNSYLLKTYYNGGTCNNFCNGFADNPITLPAHVPMGLCKDTVRKVKKLKYVTYKYDSATICYQKKVSCGKNTSPFADDIQNALPAAASEMMLTPNPASSRLNIAVANGKTGAYRADIMDVTGRVISSSIVQLAGQNFSAGIDVAGLKKGYYMLKLSGNGKTVD
jgi:hypothetical protein